MTGMTKVDAPPTRHRDPISLRFGEALISRALLNRHELDRALEHGDQQRVPLVEAVIDLGLVPESESYSALAEFTGFPLVDLSDMTPSSLALRLVPERVARRHMLLPLSE